MDDERLRKEETGAKYVDVLSPGGVTVRAFEDGTAFALGGFGGKYVKFGSTGVWDYDAAGEPLQHSHADER